ncbi:MAG: acetyl-CoA acetyltransferase [Acidobacteriota bacterium]|nr:acetyl-CoA acetyltransferase [Blastocatellia bacterium]MDW8240911.1 acetyl-CoA acetyltransferase [Acidobacteriota bacterium]
MNGPFKRNVVIAGVAESDLGHDIGLTILQHQALAARRALDDAGLSKHDVNAVMAVDFLGLPSLQIAEYLGIQPQFTDTTVTGGAAFENLVEHATLAIHAGLCDVVLITYGSTLHSDRRRVIERGGIDPRMPPTQFETPYGDLSPISAYALAAMRHMHEFGTTSEQLAHVAVSTRQWAMMNPQALMRLPITIDDVLASPMVCSPLHRLDCCVMTDGGGAIVLTSAERAGDLRRAPVYVIGSGFYSTHHTISQMQNLTTTGAVVSGRRAFQIAGVTPDDIDVVQIYDSFTISVILAVEDLGFCQKGEGGAFVENGRLGPDGDLPTNTSGGGLSYTHPGALGLFLIIEAVRQLRGECGARQVPGAQLALVHGIGGWLSSHATLILAR